VTCMHIHMHAQIHTPIQHVQQRCFDGVMGARSPTLFCSLARAHTQTHTHTHTHTHKLSLPNTPSSFNGWAFDGGLSEAFALFTLGDCTNNTAGDGRGVGVEEGGLKGGGGGGTG